MAARYRRGSFFVSKHALFLSLFVTFFFILAPFVAHAGTTSSIVDTSSLENGIVKITYTSPAGTAGLDRIGKGDVKYDYNLKKGAHYPLQMGNGDYSVTVAVAVGKNKYKVIAQENVSLKMQNENAVFLQSIPIIDWNLATKAVDKAIKLTANLKSDRDKVAVIYKFITKNIKYDNKKAQTVKSDYVPDLDKVYASFKGICYDYAAIFAAMARSQGIPTKLIMGYEAHAPNTYHAWNQVYLKDLKKWVTIDTTYDSTRVQNGQATPMFKNDADYAITKIY